MSTLWCLLVGGACLYLLFLSKKTGVAAVDGWIYVVAFLGMCCMAPLLAMHAAGRWATLVGVRGGRRWSGVVSVILSVLEFLFGAFWVYVVVSSLINDRNPDDLVGKIIIAVMGCVGGVLMACGGVSAVAAIALYRPRLL